MTMDQINGKLADDINAVKRDVKKIQAVATTGCIAAIVAAVVAIYMERYEPPFEITNRMLNRVSSILEKLGRIETWRTLERQPHLRRNNRIQSVHSSLKIEANSLSLDSVRDGRHGDGIFVL